MNSSGSPPSVTREDIERLFSKSDEPCTPFTTAEVAKRLECPERTAEQKLGALADIDELQCKEIDPENRVWWQPSDQTDSADQQSGLQEFGAFVSAVKDYAIFMLDPDGTVASWNQGAKRIKGYPEDEIVGKHFSTFYTDEDIEDEVPETNLETAVEAGRVEDEGWRVRKDGSRFWANVTITAIRDLDGTLQGFTKVTRDMTEQREYELQLRKERDLTEQILETAPVGICVVDSNGESRRANRQALELLGTTAVDFEDFSIGSIELYDGEGTLVPNDDKPWTRVIDTGQPVYDFQCRAEWSSDGYQWLSINAVPLEGALSGDNGIVISLEDITDRKEYERRLERRKEELETELSEILGRISDAFFALDDDWQFTHLNDRAAELFQRPEDELFGRSFWEVFPNRTEGELWEEFRRAMDAQEPANFELYDEGLDAWLEYNVYPSESGLSIYVHDITDRREYQQKLEESNERLEQFAHAASHDLQEPLRMVSSYLQLIDSRYGDELDEDAEEFLEFAVNGADRMRDMIDSLLTYSRVETRGKPFEPVDLNDVLAEVRDDLQRRITESDAEITVEPLPRIEGDDSQLRQLFQNLLDNAIEYSGDEPPRVHVDAERTGDRWTVSVTDEGIGIDSDNTDSVFEVFNRLHTSDEYDGTGIGLALCERIVERHGGEIWVDSEPGDGATFSFTVPARDE
ncbi:PAS domain-containing sensor histidine kinase [Natronorubrum sp. FCH18a]|uniref:PAS domain-containing sensor histidine kinase n=1 Tax=Natronorubrum sp. FCH18a TaxID=3447018 RepID=UPI003F519E1E